jgi:hypothetical protein
VNERSRKIGRDGWYPNATFSKDICPPESVRGFASGGSCGLDLAEKLHDEGRENLSGCVFGLEIEENLHVQQTLPDLAIDGAEKVERHGQLEYELVDHYQIANGHRPYAGS